jgi:hypothetical protein
MATITGPNHGSLAQSSLFSNPIKVLPSAQAKQTMAKVDQAEIVLLLYFKNAFKFSV